MVVRIGHIHLRQLMMWHSLIPSVLRILQAMLLAIQETFINFLEVIHFGTLQPQK